MIFLLQSQTLRKLYSNLILFPMCVFRLKHVKEWDIKLSQLYFMKGLTLIEEGYCNDALNLVSQLNSDDVKFIYLK